MSTMSSSRSMSLCSTSSATPVPNRRTLLPGKPPRATAERSSLVPMTLEEMALDTDQQRLLQDLQTKGQAALTRAERLERQRSLNSLNLPSFTRTCKERGVAPLRRSQATILQINIGLYCNQACSHCHVESSPRRTEAMDHATAARCLDLLRASPSVRTLDITGGAPELHQEFRFLVAGARALGVEVIDRCNLTVLLEPGQEDLPAFLADNQVRVVASLPCYSASNVDAQRGRGVFERSLDGLRLLNAQGYGVDSSGLQLDLVYNPGGAFLAPAQAKLEAAYKSELSQAYGITFTRLLALNNMPIKRFADWLVRQGQMEEYMQLLVAAFNPAAGESLMCRDTVSVRYDGRLYDCDFNQQLGMSMVRQGSAAAAAAAAAGEMDAGMDDGAVGGEGALSVWDLHTLEDLTGRRIGVDNHCFGCTAGSGSSCQGATS